MRKAKWNSGASRVFGLTTAIMLRVCRGVRLHVTNLRKPPPRPFHSRQRSHRATERGFGCACKKHRQ